jgi:hypothetical protein
MDQGRGLMREKIVTKIVTRIPPHFFAYIKIF